MSYALELCLRLSRACATLTRRLDSSLGSVHGISYSDFQVLLHMERAPGGRLRRVDLADRLGLTASGVTRLLLPLEKIGLVTREADPRDARVGYAVLTTAGRRLLKDARTTALAICKDLIKGADGSQLDNLLGVLAQITGRAGE